MRQIRVSKRHRPRAWRLDPLPLGLRDPDIVRAKELARRSRPGDGPQSRRDQQGGQRVV